MFCSREQALSEAQSIKEAHPDVYLQSHTPPPAAPPQTVETLHSWPNTRFHHTAHNTHPLSCKQRVSSYVEPTPTSTSVCQTHTKRNTTKNTPHRCIVMRTFDHMVEIRLTQEEI
ncbi:hypothetical protein KUCAC02_036139 [Chaenocephalus aceratus]|nr:hypothetical protein KUCAC02_036139 [Chaenocephalus aceratus]